MRSSIDKIALLIVFLFFGFLTFWARDIPFFWDSAVYCQISHYYYDNNFSSLIVPSDLDPAGSPMIYWMYLGAIWKIFGKTVLVSHLAILPFLLGITWEYYKIAKKFLPPNLIVMALALLIVEPTFISQSIFLAYDIPKAYLFLLAMNALIDRKNILFSIAICLLSLSSIRGMLFAFSLFLIHSYIFKTTKRKDFGKELLLYLPSVFVVTGWTFYHYYHTGWILFSSSDYYSQDRNTVSVQQMFRQCIFIFWELFDFGRIFIWAFICMGITYMLTMRIRISQQLKLILFIIFIPLFISVLSICPFSIPVGHKYFIVLFLLSHILFLYIIHQLFLNKKIVFILFTVVAASLITGNFWIYGGGFSNGWDSSLKSLPYFQLRNKMIRFIKDEKINPEEIGTKFPLYHNSKISDLSERSFEYTDMRTDALKKYKFILQSNISNQFTLAEQEALNNEWDLVKKYEYGQVYIKLFRNPDK